MLRTDIPPGWDERTILTTFLDYVRATVHAKDFLGEYLDFHVKVGDVVLQARAHPSLRTPAGDPIYVRMKAEKCVAIPSDMTPKSTVTITTAVPAN